VESLSAAAAEWTHRNFVHLSGDTINGRMSFSVADVKISACVTSLSAAAISSDQTLAKKLDVTGIASLANLSAAGISASALAATSISVSDASITLAGETISVRNELSALDSRIKSNAENASRLSGRYDSTFLKTEHVNKDGKEDLSADNLRLFDEFTYAGEDGHREYRMILSAGTIVLKKVD
jgi:hypothetical protein